MKRTLELATLKSHWSIAASHHRGITSSSSEVTVLGMKRFRRISESLCEKEKLKELLKDESKFKEEFERVIDRYKNR